MPLPEPPIPEAEPVPEPAVVPTPAPSASKVHRARRLAEIFGDVLPESTGDDRDQPSAGRGDPDAWYTENRPPHHDAR